MSEYLQILDRFFTPEQQTALFIITVGSMALTQMFKTIYFGFHRVKAKEKKKAIIWLFALITGTLGGYIGYKIGHPPQPLWFWIFSGVSSGWAAIGLFQLGVEIIWPRLKSIGKNPNA